MSFFEDHPLLAALLTVLLTGLVAAGLLAGVGYLILRCS